MNVYDFDKTIYDGDSTIDFYVFNVKKDLRLLRFFPKQLFGLFKYLVLGASKETFKEDFYCYLKAIDVNTRVKEFWSLYQNKIKTFYWKQKKEDDVIISASSEFLLKPIIEVLKVRLIASKNNPKTGKFEGLNCYGKEKVHRFHQEYQETIDEFYSDSFSDLPMSQLAIKSYIVKKEEIIPWDEYKPSTISKCKQMFFSKQFIQFLFIGVINTINGIAFSYLYSLFLNPNIAFIFGYLTSLGIAYVLNSTLVFKHSLSFQTLTKFAISYIPNFIIQNLVVLLVYNVLHFHKLIAYGLAAILGIPITFIFLKIFAFKKH